MRHAKADKFQDGYPQRAEYVALVSVRFLDIISTSVCWREVGGASGKTELYANEKQTATAKEWTI